MKEIQAISCIIPSYNGLELLQKHLPSIFASLKSGDQIIIADDASSDETVTWLTKTYNLEPVQDRTPAPDDVVLFSNNYKAGDKHISVLLMHNQTNQRFGQSVNRAVVFCQHPFFFLVNNDVDVEKNAVDVLREAVAEDATIFAIGCLEYEHSKDGQKSGKNKLWFEKGIFQHSKASSFESGPTAWASGGSALFSTDKWRELGGFDAAFHPAYWEDIDISYRARKKGWKVLFNSDSVVYHKHESTNSSVFGGSHLQSMSWKNSLTFAWKHSSMIQKLEFIFWYPYWWVQRMRHLHTA